MMIIASKALKFADDTKVFRRIRSVEDRQHLQDDLSNLTNSNVSASMGHGTNAVQYTMGGVV